MPATATTPSRTQQPSRHRESTGLSREEVADLSARAAVGDQEARNRLVEHNLGLVRTIAADFRGRGLEMDDLVGEGRLGLLRAAERFDPRFGTRFSTYAAYWIRQAIRAALAEKAPAIRLPTYLVKLLTRWRRAERRLEAELGRRPSFDEVAAALGLGDRQRETVAAALRIRLEGANGAGDGLRFDERVPNRGESAAEAVEAEEERAGLPGRLGRLGDRERAVVSWHFGLGGDPMTHREIGLRLGLTRERVRQIEKRALSMLGAAPAE